MIASKPVLSKWAHWNAFYLSIPFVLPSLHFLFQAPFPGENYLDKGWFFEITHRDGTGFSSFLLLSSAVLPSVLRGQPSSRRPPLLKWRCALLLRTWRQRSGMVPSRSFCRTQRQQTTWLSLTRSENEVTGCPFLWMTVAKRPRESLLCPQLKVSSCCEGVTSLASAVAKGQSQQGRHGKLRRWEQVFSSLILGAAYFLQ